MEKIIIANHKMNLNKDQIKNYINVIKNTKLNIVIAPTSIYIPYFIENNIKTALQNIYSENEGYYTGEISPMQAKKMNVEYVMIGHSERRRVFNETDEDINKKIKKALENNLKVILFIGDNIGEDYKEILHNQIIEDLKDVTKEVIIAYEPVYAIGTNITPEKEELKEIIKYIKNHFKYNVKVLYGGSVTKKTAKNLKMNELDGYVIASSSLNPDEFLEIGEVLS